MAASTSDRGRGRKDLLRWHPGAEEAATLPNDRKVEQEIWIGPAPAVGKAPTEGIDVHLIGRSSRRMADAVECDHTHLQRGGRHRKGTGVEL